MEIREYSDWSNQVYPNDALFSKNQVSKIIIHHTWLPRADSVGDSVVASIQKYHKFSRGWLDIGYHYVIDSSGVLYKGRYEKHNGSHCRGYNSKSLGICLIGDYSDGYDVVSDSAWDSLVYLLNDLMGRYGLGRSAVFGHRDFSKKLCPGYNLYKKILGFKEDV